jgi:Xaa-Pro aminopeptidase
MIADNLPFSVHEYRDRARRVRAEMERRGIDVLYVMSPANMCYLTGFESIWYPPRAPLGVVVTRSADELVFVDYERHRSLVEMTAHFDDAIFFTYETALDTVAAEFATRGWTEGTVGVEWHAKSPSGPLIGRVADALRERGAEVVDGDWIVDRVRLVKSAAEVACVRRAAEIVDTAFLGLRDEVRPGMTELQIAARLTALMADAGGEEPAIRTMVSAGPLVWCRTHGAPTRRPVEVGDVMYVDTCGVYNRYHADLCRTVAIGKDHPQARAILEATSQSVLEVQKAVKPGDPLDVAQRVAEEYVFSRFPREQIWWVGGYALGIALPPDWVGHTYLSNDAYEPFTWEPGYVTNYENILFDRNGGFTASYMETLLMTEQGIEILSKVPRTLTVIPA